MTRNKPSSRALTRRAAPLLWVVGSFLLFYLLFFDPLGIHPVDSWLQHLVGYHVGSSMQASPPQHQAEQGGEILFYRNPMDATITSPVPAKDEMGMDYVPVYADEAAQAVSRGPGVTIDPAVLQNMNVQTARVSRRDLIHPIRTVGYLEYDQQRMVTVTTKYTGWVEKVYVNYVGEPVRKGQPLFEIYSPELVQTEQELLSAIEYASKFDAAAADARRRAGALVEAARTRLSYWDISPEQIDQLEETGEIFRTLTVVAPADGLVMKRMPGLEGKAVTPGMETYHIANMSSLWLSVEVFEDQLAWIREGARGRVTFTYFPGETFRGTVRYIEPEFSEKTRTLRAKLEVPNPGGRLRAGMFATVVFEPIAARDVLTVPSLAVLRTGQRNVVVVAAGEGRFVPRDVTLGHAGEGYVAVLDGIEDGELVVTSAQFLLDSEASLQEAIQKMIAKRQAMPEGGEETGHGAEPMESEEPETEMDHSQHGGMASATEPERAEPRAQMDHPARIGGGHAQ